MSAATAQQLAHKTIVDADRLLRLWREENHGMERKGVGRVTDALLDLRVAAAAMASPPAREEAAE